MKNSFYRALRNAATFATLLCAPMLAAGQGDPEIDLRPDLPSSQKAEYGFIIDGSHTLMPGSTFWLKVVQPPSGKVLFEVGNEHDPSTWQHIGPWGETKFMAPRIRDTHGVVTVRVRTDNKKEFRATCSLIQAADNYYKIFADPLIGTRTADGVEVSGRFRHVNLTKDQTLVGVYLVCDPNYLQYSD